MTDGFVSEVDIAATYDGGAYVDAHSALEQYREVMDYASRHPDLGSAAVASRLEMARSRIRPWMDGGAPDVVRGLETARSRGWLEVSDDSPAFAAVNQLVAGIFSGGSIGAEDYRPIWAVDRRGRDPGIGEALEALGVGATVLEGREGRADEIRAGEDGSVLGRVLVVLGAPHGPKAEQRLTLPTYLEGAPDSVREGFVQTYLANRGTGRDTGVVTIREERGKRYLGELRALIADVSGESVTISEQNVILSRAAVEALGLKTGE